MEGLDN